MTEHLIGALARRALRRADAAPLIEGAVMHPMSEGTSATGGWRRHKRVPDAHRLNKMAVTAAGAALCLGALAWASTRPRR